MKKKKIYYLVGFLVSVIIVSALINKNEKQPLSLITIMNIEALAHNEGDFDNFKPGYTYKEKSIPVWAWNPVTGYYVSRYRYISCCVSSNNNSACDISVSDPEC